MAIGKFAAFGNDLHSGARSFGIVRTRRYWYLISLAVLIILGSITAVRGVNLGIEFTGGSEFQVTGAKTLNQSLARDAVHQLVPENVPHVTVVGSDTIRVQTEQLGSDRTEALRTSLASAYGVDSSQVTSSFIGPSWGQDVTGKAIRAVIVFTVLVAIVLALYFRNLKTSIAAVMALAHDLLLTAGTYGAVGFEITPAAVIGFLTILGYSLYDTVVVFDKVRENTVGIAHRDDMTYAGAVNLAVNQTLVRSINTSVVALLPVGSILFIGAFVLGAGTLKDISLALFVGILVGTYSSVFLAPSFLVDLRRREPALRAQEARLKELKQRQDREASGSEGETQPHRSGSVESDELTADDRVRGHQGLDEDAQTASALSSSRAELGSADGSRNVGQRPQPRRTPRRRRG
ncbi:protein translocase subunit SecF [Devriesea agamarum]|uniref:protein translocase subunit SecF n=1 Tax=Devriesea agamarum TaxID=472569 RepID=UPI000A04490F|nr:protein translocase subunit SecF [Devriesea agamarum]